MKDELIEFKTAALAKEKGFNIETYALYSAGELFNPEDSSISVLGIPDDSLHKFNHNKCVDSTCSAPTQSLLQKWLREIHKIDVCSYKFYHGKFETMYGTKYQPVVQGQPFMIETNNSTTGLFFAT